VPPRSITAPLTSGNIDSFKSRLLFFEMSICLLQPSDGSGESHPDEHEPAICQVAAIPVYFLIKIGRWNIVVLTFELLSP
jgi:hypothetical protein